MGYFTRPNSLGGEIHCFVPDNTPDEFYIECWGGFDLSDIIERACEHFGIPESTSLESFVSEFTIRCEHIHTDCLYYDRYDSMDYTNYLIIERKI